MMTRRSFVTLPAAAAVASGPAVGPSDTVRTAFIGVGKRGRTLLRETVQIPGVELVALCDINPESLGQATQIVTAAATHRAPDHVRDFRRLLDRKDIDAVFVAVPDYLHKEVVMAALELGKHVYSEKPMALTVEDCRMIRTAARGAKGIYQVGMQLRYDPHLSRSVELIHEGKIGRILYCHCTRHGGDLPRDRPWYMKRDLCGDMVTDQGIHLIDIFSWANKAHAVRAYGLGGINLFKEDPPGRTTMDHYTLVLEYPGEVKLNFSHMYFDPQGYTGTRAVAFGSEMGIDLNETLLFERSRGGQKEKEEVDTTRSATYRAIEAFYHSVRAGAKPERLSVDAAYQATLTAFMATKAIYEERVVTWAEIDA
jgi:predicted dehydrogenase